MVKIRDQPLTATSLAYKVSEQAVDNVHMICSSRLKNFSLATLRDALLWPTNKFQALSAKARDLRHIRILFVSDHTGAVISIERYLWPIFTHAMSSCGKISCFQSINDNIINLL